MPAFAILMHNQAENPALGILPPDAYVLPLGVHTVLGGLLFGAGMVIAGGCVSGRIYRTGEGYITSFAVGGIMVGLPRQYTRPHCGTCYNPFQAMTSVLIGDTGRLSPR